jgi:hypothetical protein
MQTMADDVPHGSNDNGAAPGEDDAHDAHAVTRVQCPNCCRLADVVRRDMGLLFYECELCGTVGAVPASMLPLE